jgi:DNA-binding LytR/AlgR family response regulator
MSPHILLLNTSTGQVFVDTGMLVRIKASSNYSKLYFSNGKTLVTAKVLKWFEEKLPSFTRMHRSHLVNNDFLQIIREDAVLLNGDFVKVSRRKRKKVVEQMNR